MFRAVTVRTIVGRPAAWTFFVNGLLLLTLLITPALLLHAQTSTTGDIVGAVTDPAASVIPNARVVLTDVDTRSVTSTITDAEGAYRFPLLKPGRYSVEASVSGFQLVNRTVAVTLGSSITVNLGLTISSQQETVEVTSGTTGVQTEDANLETTFDATQIAALPNPGNDLSAVALTSPGVVMNTTGGSTFGGGNYEFFGLPSNSNVFTYDGANGNDPYFNINSTGATNLSLGLNDVQETSVVTNGYSGQYGGLAGANINYVSKSGTNAFHGNAEYWWNGRALNANNFFLNQQGSPRQFVNANQYATSVGGPVKKDKAFFFVDYEAIRLVIPSLSSVNVPTQPFENAVISNLNTVSPASVPFYNQLFGLWNGAPGSARAQNVLPGGGCSNVTTIAGTAFGSSNPCALQFQGGTSQATNDYLIVGRYDQNIGNNDKVFVRVQHESGQQATYTDPINPAFDAQSAQPEWQSQVSETHTFGNNKVNNLVASMQWYSALFNFGNPAAEAQALPETLALGDGSLFNLNNLGSFFPQGRNVTQYGVVDDFSWTHGKHNFRLGINFRRDDVSDHNFTFTTPFAEAVTLNDFAFGGVAPGTQGGSVFQQAFPVNSDVPIALYQLGWYVSDEVRVNRDLKLTLSMRFDHISNPVCQTNCFQSLDGAFQTLNPSAPVNQALITGLHTAFPSVTSVVYEPKVGFAWSPFGAKNTVIRGGIGIFSDAIPTGAIDDVLTNAPNDPSFNVFNGALAPAASGSLNSQAAAANAGFRTNFTNGGAVAPFNFFNPGPVKVPRYDEWDLEVQHSLGWNTIVSAKYVGNHGEHEELTNPALNAFSPTGFGGLPTSAPNGEFGVVGQTQNVANSNYNGVVVSVSHNMNGGFQFQASYTYSHALDEISNNSLNPFGVNTFTNVDVVTPLNPFNPRLNYGNADYDIRHSFVMNYVWSNSFRHLTSWGPDALMKGWTFSGTIFKHTGFPYSIYSSNATALLQQSLFGSGAAATATAVLANVAGTPNVNCSSSAADLVNGNPNPCYSAANFSDPTNAFSGQRRNQFRGPGYFDTDFNVEKSFKVPRWESANLSVGARFFNLFNHPNFAFPNTNIDSPQFGQITSTVSQPTTIYGSGLGADASPRVIELQAKFVF